MAKFVHHNQLDSLHHAHNDHHQYDLQRPSTAPDGHVQHDPIKPPSSSHHHTFEVPRIAIFADALSSFHNLRSKTRTLRKSPTLDNLSASAQTPQNRSFSSASSVSSSSEAKPLAARRPPASRSSHGIATTLGPPPALITRGSYELALCVQSPAAATLVTQKQKPYNTHTPSRDSLRIESVALDHHIPRDDFLDGYQTPFSPTSLTPNHNQSLDAMMDRSSPQTAQSEFLDDKSSSRYTDALSSAPGALSGGEGEESGRSTEDLFLNLAQDSPEPSQDDGNQSRLERRLVSVLSCPFPLNAIIDNHLQSHAADVQNRDSRFHLAPKSHPDPAETLAVTTLAML
jgi:hypothetical protein